jgi:hypothetical protein
LLERYQNAKKKKWMTSTHLRICLSTALFRI